MYKIQKCNASLGPQIAGFLCISVSPSISVFVGEFSSAGEHPTNLSVNLIARNLNFATWLLFTMNTTRVYYSAFKK